MTIDYRNGVAILQLIIYLPYLFTDVYICFRHGFRKSSGFVYLVIFCLLRIVGAAAELATISDTTSDTPYTIAAVTSAIGTSPLLLATLALISTSYNVVNEVSGANKFSALMLRIPQLLVTIGLILGIVAATSASSPEQIANESTLKIAEILFTIALILIIFLTLRTLAIYRSNQCKEVRWLILAVVLSIPFIIVKIIYALVSTFAKLSAFNLTTGNVTIMLVMVVIEEFVVVALYTIAGIKTQELPKTNQSNNIVPGNSNNNNNNGRMMNGGGGGRGAGFSRRRPGLIGLAVSAAQTAFASPSEEVEKPAHVQINQQYQTRRAQGV